MLLLKDIVKDYNSGDTTVRALNYVSLAFRKNEFVSILGHSGCGKTTMLNIIGGLDRYTSGVMSIKGISTEKYNDSDWDTYRNHSIGFVFQTYNLISHQTVLSNVELALTLTGVSASERKKRATEILKKVGLGDQIHKKPNQLSGGQMQRVAIARALINDPEILLADEPTGALDTETSVQIMELLKEISHDKLIIMVTHNPELAEKYSDRIIRLKDGEVTDDSNPYSEEDEKTESAEKSELSAAPTNEKKAKKKRPSMSFFTALSLSFNNLLTKKARTFLTSFAGSIGIIGIALIMSLSNGINAYIATVQEDTLSTYPLSIEKDSQDLSAMLGAMTAVGESEDHRDSNMVFVDDSMGTMVSAMSATVSNNLEKFKSYLEANRAEIDPYISSIQYTYDFNLQVFSSDGKTQVNPTTLFDNMGDAFSGVTDMMNASGMNISVMSEMIDNQELLDQQYDVVAGAWPKEANEIVLVISENNQISKMTLYMLGVLDQSEVEDIMTELMKPGGNYNPPPVDPISFDDFLNMSFRLVNTSDFYVKTDKTYPSNPEYSIWKDIRNDIDYSDKQASFVTTNGIELKISGIIRPKAGATVTSISTNLAYTKGLTDYILAQNAESEIIKQQKAEPEYNVLTGLKFERTVYTPENIGDLIDTIDDATMETLYAYMTEQVHNQFVATPPVNKDTFILYVSVMNAEEQTQLLSAMMNAVAEKDPSGMMLSGLCTSLSDETLAVTPQNLIRVYPILEKEKQMTAILGLSQLCGETAMTGIYAYMNEQLMNMTVNEDNFEQILQFIGQDEKIFNQLQDMLYQLAPQTDATLESTLYLLGDAESAKPASINFYAKDFESKDAIEAFIKEYNNGVEKIDKIKYTDMVGILMSSVTTIVNAISYVLIFFVSISLVVSSIMIGIITYISVLERTKEIGILRAVGASKRDISRVFNAETLIIGFAAGLLGIGVTLLLCIPINLILRALTGISSIGASLPPLAAVILVAISMGLTLIAGLFPSRIASKKDPVVALRTE